MILLVSLRSEGWTAWSEQVDEFNGLRSVISMPRTFVGWCVLRLMAGRLYRHVKVFDQAAWVLIGRSVDDPGHTTLQ